MAEQEKKPPFYEHRAFQGAVAVVGLLTAVWALVGAPRPWTVATEIAAVETPLSNTEVVLVADRSMSESFDGTTKMEAAVEAIEVIGRATSNQGLALRRAGERCGEPGEQLVGFGSHHGDDIVAEAEDVVPAGQADLSSAVNAALDDLEHPSLNQPGARKGVVVFLGGKDECNPETVSDIRREIEAHGVSPQFKIIALVDSKRERAWVGRLEAGLRPWDVDVVEATTREEVQETAADAIEETAAGLVAPPSEEPGEEGEEGREAGGEDGGAESSATPTDPEEELPPEGEEEGEEEGELEEGEEAEPGRGEEEGEGTVAPGQEAPPLPPGEAAESGAVQPYALTSFTYGLGESRPPPPHGSWRRPALFAYAAVGRGNGLSANLTYPR